MIANGPKVYLVSGPSLDFKAIQAFLLDRNVDWLRTEGASNAEELIELSGRICYMSFSGDQKRVRYPNKNYILNLIDSGHHSVLEHANWTFIIDRVSRALTHQLVRHRIGFSYSQLSQQYHDETAAEFVVPEEVSSNPELYSAWRDFVLHARLGYKQFLSALGKDESRINKEELRSMRSAARSLLPNATETALSVSANARALRHFFSERGGIIGDIEMRNLVAAMFELVNNDSPSLFVDFELSRCVEGWPLLRKRSST